MKEFKSIIEKYNPSVGSTVSESIAIAKDRAKVNDCIILLRFNSVDIFVNRSSDCDFLERYYMYKCSIHKYEVALND